VGVTRAKGDSWAGVDSWADVFQSIISMTRRLRNDLESFHIRLLVAGALVSQRFSFKWPSVVYALDIVAWDFCFGLALPIQIARRRVDGGVEASDAARQWHARIERRGHSKPRIGGPTLWLGDGHSTIANT
jgi:hypothetical protein